MGGKSRKVSDAVEWYFSPRGDHPSYEDLLQNIAGLQLVIKQQAIDIEALKNRKNDANTPPLVASFLAFLDLRNLYFGLSL